MIVLGCKKWRKAILYKALRGKIKTLKYIDNFLGKFMAVALEITGFPAFGTII